MTATALDTKSGVNIVAELAAAVGPDNVLHRAEDLLLYEYDGSVARRRPDAVVFPASTQEVVEVVNIARARGIPVVARGAGTGLAGGCIPLQGGIVLSTSRMNRIISIDYRNMIAVVEPGVVNLDLTAEVAPRGFQYVPDPSSEKASTIGGNVATNAGGPHTLAYGVTTNHVLELEVVTPQGEVVTCGGAAADAPGYDLRGVIVGSEGTLAIVTRITVRLMHSSESVRTLLAVYDSVDEATVTVSGIIAAGIIPAAMELMDQTCTRAVAKWLPSARLPTDAGAILIIEVEGLEDGIDDLAASVDSICRASGATEIRIATKGSERNSLWVARKGAFGAIGVLAPNYYVQDGVIPRTKLPEVLRAVYEIGQEYGFEMANVFHAGDGNIHPLILFDEREEGALERVMSAGKKILQACLDVGGTLTGEHGIGMEKIHQMPELFSESDLGAMLKIRDVFSSDRRFNPGKIFPGPESADQAETFGTAAVDVGAK